MSNLNLNNFYSFSLYPNTVLGNSFSNAKLVAILDYNNALKYGNIELFQNQIAPYLPPGTSLNNVLYTYYLFEIDNKKIIVADAWLMPNSILQTNGLNYVIKLNNITAQQYTTIRDQLRLLGVSFDLIS